MLDASTDHTRNTYRFSDKVAVEKPCDSIPITAMHEIDAVLHVELRVRPEKNRMDDIEMPLRVATYCYYRVARYS